MPRRPSALPFRCYRRRQPRLHRLPVTASTPLLLLLRPAQPAPSHQPPRAPAPSAADPRPIDDTTAAVLICPLERSTPADVSRTAAARAPLVVAPPCPCTVPHHRARISAPRLNALPALPATPSPIDPRGPDAEPRLASPVPDPPAKPLRLQICDPDAREASPPADPSPPQHRDQIPRVAVPFAALPSEPSTCARDAGRDLACRYSSRRHCSPPIRSLLVLIAGAPTINSRWTSTEAAKS
ncbi:predicted GPI-anchored protein 58 [Eucalyptus grandis]|uniref:predicted GPI-anchored protein 58 n=1 Tax=Eucalyptus grandis TaxID=71139 RepID=UPI00192EE827|nr:predicted GPI-anchored protein 58 [Eucalyptus grandis]